MKTAITHLTRGVGKAEYVGTFPQDSPEWHAARLSMIGSSDIPIILGLSTFKSAYTLWHEKVGLIQPSPPDEKWQRKLDYGHHMEPFVAGLFQKKHPELFVQETGTWRNRDNPWQGCNPDRLVLLSDSPADEMTPHSALELKTFPSLSDWDYGPPLGYVAQLQWQLDTFGWQRGVLAGYANLSGDYVEYEIELNPFEADAVRAKAWEFDLSVREARQVLKDAGPEDDVQAILQELAPEIDGSEGTYQTLRRLNPSLVKGTDSEIPEEVAESYLDAAKALKAADSSLNKWKGHLLAHMGTAHYAVYDGKRIASRVAIKDGIPYLKEA
jgi:putative phage-type endonuclease